MSLLFKELDYLHKKTINKFLNLKFEIFSAYRDIVKIVYAIDCICGVYQLSFPIHNH